ncbi:hypothetical protein HJA60_004213 [Vibrio vulnificus]|uniref:hypothetical protein n=1 Tax=Vibrio vulnificus TaxID=672 RepID=UPI00102A6939|nr:hypothetical protein [Vibrio vulnificus]EGQ7950908.1 hypothetical protein [Vibrio vulnificus]EGQ7984135.1 hypothetical protein [Vibrio vulnificus]
MKILIYGEYSGYAESLRHGFKSLGHEVEVFSHGNDGFKKISPSISLKGKSFLHRLFSLYCLIPTFLKFDKILILNPSFFTIFKGLGMVPLFSFVLFRKDAYLLCCGDDVEYVRACRYNLLDKHMYKGVDHNNKKYFNSTLQKFVHSVCSNYAKKIIPTMYDYEAAWGTSKYSNKLTKVIPLACKVINGKSIKSTNRECINILHGINRPSVKGTTNILSALELIKSEYGERVAIYTPEKLPRDEYLKLFDMIDINIDQCKCHAYGMNAIYALMHGQIVLSPADEKCLESMGVSHAPIISISDSVDSIYEELKKTLDRTDTELNNLKYEGKNYAFANHDSVIIANKLSKIIGIK